MNQKKIIPSLPIDCSDDLSSDLKKNIALSIIGFGFLSTVSLISPFIIMQLKSPLPYMGTPRKKALEALGEIHNRLNKRHGLGMTLETTSSPNYKTKSLVSKYSKKCWKQVSPNFYDLGSGDGEIVLAAASHGWNATGVELNPTLWLISSIRRLFSPRMVRERSKFILGDLWSQNLEKVDAIMVFGVKPIMGRLANKISRECKPGTFLMSYRFRLPTILYNEESTTTNDLENVLEEDDECYKRKLELDATMIYDKEEMRIYRTNSCKNYMH